MSSPATDKTATVKTNDNKMSFREQIAWVAEHWRQYTNWLPLILILTAANACAVVMYPIIFKQIIDGVQAAKSGSYFVRQTMLLVGIGLVQSMVYAFLQYYRARLNLAFEYTVRLRAFEHVTRMGQSFFGRFRTGDIVTRLMDDVSHKLSWYMCSGIFRVIEALAIVVSCVIAMCSINPWLTLVAAGPLPILIFTHIISSNRLNDRYEKVQQTISQLNDSLETCFSGMRVVKSFTAESMQRESIAKAIDENRIAEVRAVRWQTIVDTMWGNIWQMGIIGILLVGGVMAMEGLVTLGDLVAFDAYILLMVWPMWDFGQFFVRGRLSSVTIDRVSEIEEFAPDVQHSDLPEPVSQRPKPETISDFARYEAPDVGQDINVDGVRFQYVSAKTPSLRDITFHAKAGDITAIVGETGAGKSTTLMLLPRLLCADEGQLNVMEKPIADWNLVRLRQRIGYVPQEANLLSGTIEENIRFGREWITDSQIHKAVEMSQLRSEINQWPDGLQTVVGSRGVRLSGGQKQRVSLARALADQPTILLLDDCTASLDAATEAEVWKSLLSEIPECTVLLVTHRPSTLREADKIVLLEEGIVQEVGRFAELNVEGTKFHRLYVQWKLREERDSSENPAAN